MGGAGYAPGEVSQSFSFNGTDGGIKWWDVQLGREVLFLTLSDPTPCPWPLALSADGRRVATSGGNRPVVWEAGPP